MRTLPLAAALLALSLPAAADTRFEATLAGHALLPAATFTQPQQQRRRRDTPAP